MSSHFSLTPSYAGSTPVALGAAALGVALILQWVASVMLMGRLGSTRLPGRALAVSGLLALVLVAALGDGHVALRLAADGLETPYGLSLGLWLDRMSSAMIALVSLVGFFVFRFSSTYLRAEAGRVGFLAWLLTTVALVQLFVLSSSLLGHALAWFGLSVSVHKLLRHYEDRYRARLVARKKFLTSRLGDLLFWAGMWLVYTNVGTLDLQELSAVYPALSDRDPFLTTTVGLLVAGAALSKSALFPLHSWLPDTMDAPTPVSAIMHAGVINAGAFLLLRAPFLLEPSLPALGVLVVAGGLSAGMGTLVGSLQANAKTRLAWSTVAQMGFLFFELGLGFSGAAALHLLAHAVYKAHAFLRTGTVPTLRSTADVSALRVLASMGAALLVVGASSALIVPRLAAAPEAYLPIATVWALGLSQFLIGPSHVPLWTRVTTMLCLGGGAWAAAWAIESAFTRSTPALASVVMSHPVTAAMVWFVTFLLGVSLLLSTATRWRGAWLQSFYVHAQSGFYFGELHDQLTRLLWRDRPMAHLPLTAGKHHS